MPLGVLTFVMLKPLSEKPTTTLDSLLETNLTCGAAGVLPSMPTHFWAMVMSDIATRASVNTTFFMLISEFDYLVISC